MNKQKIASELLAIAKTLIGGYEQERASLISQMRSIRIRNIPPQEKKQKLDELQKKLDALKETPKPMGVEITYDGDYVGFEPEENADEAIKQWKQELEEGKASGFAKQKFEQHKLKLKKKPL